MLGWNNINDKNKSPFLDILLELNSMLSIEGTKFSSGGYGDVWNDTDVLNTFFERMAKVIETGNKLSRRLMNMNSAINRSNQKLLKLCNDEIKNLNEEEKTEHIILNQLLELKKIAFELDNESIEDDKLGKIYEGISRIYNFSVKSIEKIEEIHKLAKSELETAQRLIKDDSYYTHKSSD
jgi:hypothetical protein